MKNKPTISVIVLTYNSGWCVRETLDSIARQTWNGPLELVITDDCSSDDTIFVCEKWCAENEKRFSKVSIIRGSENIGISKNMNRGCKVSSGEWVKPIAGDDILEDRCLDILYEAATTLNAHAVSSAIRVFAKSEMLAAPESLEIWNPGEKYPVIGISEIANNLKLWIPAPTFFLSRQMLEDIGYYPEVIRNIEDAPMIRNIVSHGYQIHNIDTPTIFYRYGHSTQVTQTMFVRTDIKYMTLKLNYMFLHDKLPILSRTKLALNYAFRHIKYLYRKRLVPRYRYVEFTGTK